MLFVFLVVIHELWHFFAAKKTWVQVIEFWIWIPPKIFTLGKDKSWTIYTLNAIPLGGFVRLKGEDPSDTKTFYAKDSFMSASVWKKIIILLAWVAVNFLFAWLMLAALFTRGVAPLSIIPIQEPIESYLTPSLGFLESQWLVTRDNVGSGIVIDQVIDGWVADSMWIFPQDRILSINGSVVDVSSFADVLASISGSIVVELERSESILSLDGVCERQQTWCVIWVMYANNFNLTEDLFFRFPFLKSLEISGQELYTQASMTFSKLWSLLMSVLHGDRQTMQEEFSGLTGPVGAVRIGESLVAWQHRSGFLAFGAMISFALAIFNILPIPALDGWRLLGVVIQTIFFRRNVEKYFTIEWIINFVFFALLMILGVYIILRDLVTMRGVSIPFIG